MKPILCSTLILLGILQGTTMLAARSDTGFTRLAPLPSPRILSSAEEYPGGSFKAQHLLDGNSITEYSSNGKGTNTFLELDFGRPTQFAAFRHVDRNDPATVSESILEFRDASGRILQTFKVAHVNQRAGVTFFALPSQVTANRVYWRITGLGKGHPTVGGAELTFYAPVKEDAVPRDLTLKLSDSGLLERKGADGIQPVRVEIDYPYAQPVEVLVKLEGAEAKRTTLKAGTQTLDFSLPATKVPRKLSCTVEALGKNLVKKTVTLKPVRPLEIYLLPHSHVDIGYTALQADVEKKQNKNIDIAMGLIRDSRDYPPEARFKWNVEVLWPVENYLRTESPEKREALLQAIRRGEVGLDAFYGNILTGLCRPEELLRLMTYATKVGAQCNVKVESAMISDVPGYTWSTVSAMAQAGVKYFSFAPNYFDRMGGTMVTWQNKPFYWVGPDGHSKVLCWCPSKGYALGHLIGDGTNLTRYIPTYLHELQTNNYPYDITHLRWNVHGDNGSPDEKLAEVVKDWNARYIYPRLIITTTADAFRKFEARYGNKLPEYRGDYTPYWEDGAGSSAQETAINRASAERLVQAETLWALRQSTTPFPASRFQEAWRNILLYSEHTWGAHNSISQPDLPFVKEQWRVKQAFALDAEKLSKELLAEALQPSSPSSEDSGELDVFNTTSWTRTELAVVSAALSQKGDRVTSSDGKLTLSQRLTTGELAFLAENVPPFSSKRYRVVAGTIPTPTLCKVAGANLETPRFRLQLNPKSGAIASLYDLQSKIELVDNKSPDGLNDYIYLPGSQVKDIQRNPAPRISLKENGPLITSLLIESEAPGCKSLTREVRIVHPLDQIEFINTVNKAPIRAKEGIHFAFPFTVPKGTPRFDVGWAAVRPNEDQIPASCKNWFSVQRWVDISNSRNGLTWVPVDAPLAELGGLTANLVGSQTDYRVWISELPPSQALYSWVMNNHWHTNYRADQEGPTIFRYYLRTHKRYSPLEAARFGFACSQPLLVSRAAGAGVRPNFTIDSQDVLVTAFKPSDDGKAQILRLFGASGKSAKINIQFDKARRQRVWLSDTSEKPIARASEKITVPGWGIVTLRLE